MKSYVIRLANWVYNDQSYDYNGHGQIGSIFSNFEEANRERAQLEREFLLDEFNSFFRFEVGPDTVEHQKDRRTKISRFLYDEFNFNPTILLNWSFYKINMFYEKPTDGQLDKLVSVIGAYQYKLIEYPESDSFEVLTAWINKKIINRNENIYLENGDSGGPRFFLSEQEAYDHLLESYELKWHLGHFNRNSYFRKSIEELTDLPNVLKDLISESPFLSHDENGLNIKYEIDKPTLGRLFKLLKDPILLFEKREIKDDDLVNLNEKYRMTQINKVWKGIEERNSKYDSKNIYSMSQERLDIFKVELPVWPKESSYYPYSKYFQGHLESHFDTEFMTYEPFFTVENKKFKLYGVISSFEENSAICKVKIHIKTNYDEDFNLKWVGLGSGEFIQIAFTNAVKNWIDTYGDLWNDRLKEIISQKPII